MERLARAPHATASPARTALLLGVSLAGAAAYVWGMHAVDLPDDLWFLVLGGAILGLLVGRWWIVLAALGTWTFPLLDQIRDEELGVLVLVVYMPVAAISIAVGVAIRKFVNPVRSSLLRR